MSPRLCVDAEDACAFPHLGCDALADRCALAAALCDDAPGAKAVSARGGRRGATSGALTAVVRVDAAVVSVSAAVAERMSATDCRSLASARLVPATARGIPDEISWRP